MEGTAVASIENLFRALDQLGEGASVLIAKLRDAWQYFAKNCVLQIAPKIKAEIERQKRIARIIAMIPQYAKASVLCCDPWHRA